MIMAWLQKMENSIQMLMPSNLKNSEKTSKKECGYVL